MIMIMANDYSATPDLIVPQLFRSEQLRGGFSHVAPISTENLLHLSTSKPLGLQGFKSPQREDFCT